MFEDYSPQETIEKLNKRNCQLIKTLKAVDEWLSRPFEDDPEDNITLLVKNTLAEEAQQECSADELCSIWLEDLKKEFFKYFVLKAEDFLPSLNRFQLEEFNLMIKQYEEYRKSKGKKEHNQYWIINRDEPYADQVKKIILDNE